MRDSPLEAAEQTESERRMKMGAVNANVVISNPANRAKSWEGVFLVDTGATDSLVPRQTTPGGHRPQTRSAADVPVGRWQ